MKITTDRISGPAGSKRAGGSRPGTGGPAFASILSEAEGAETHETAAVRGPGPIDSLLAAQEVPDGTVARRRAVIRGRSILDQLDRLRIALISGAIPQSQLNRLVTLVESERAGLSDPHLLGVLDEIELRARVEIAKYEAHPAKKP